MKHSVFNYRSILIVGLVLTLNSSFSPLKVKAAAGLLTTLSDSLSNNHINATNVSHTVRFTTADSLGSTAIQRVDIRFSSVSGNTTKPAGLNLTSATLGVVSGLGNGWVLDTSSASGGLLSITNTSSQTVNASTVSSVTLNTITNSALGSCATGTNIGLQDICSITVTSFDDTGGSNQIDIGATSYSVIEDPSLSFEVYAVASGQIHNSITSTLASTPSSLSFGILEPGDVKYIAQRLHITTNAPHGYAVYAYLTKNITGSYSNNSISPFGATNATWLTPQSWTTPTGNIANSNTGWIGANTTDIRVDGWSTNDDHVHQVGAKFGPVSTSKRAVAYSSAAERSGNDIYITYALGVNTSQPADSYSGDITYDIQANY